MTGFIYLIHSPAMNAVKIGYTGGDPAKRLRALQIGTADDLELIAAYPGSQRQEAMHHEAFADLRLRGEWFRFDESIVDAVRHVAESSPSLDTKPPLTSVGKVMLAISVSVNGARKRYPDGGRHSETDWDELGAQAAEDEVRFEQWMAAQ